MAPKGTGSIARDALKDVFDTVFIDECGSKLDDDAMPEMITNVMTNFEESAYKGENYATWVQGPKFPYRECLENLEDGLRKRYKENPSVKRFSIALYYMSYPCILSE